MQYVEFVGPPGSGKSTLRKCLSKKSNCCTVEDEVVSLVRSDRSPKVLSTLFRLLPRVLIGKRPDDLIRFSGLRMKLLDDFMERYLGVQPFLRDWDSVNCLKNKELALERFLTTAAKYQAIGKEKAKEYCLTDEGFLQKTVSLFLSPGQTTAADENLLKAYLLAVPLPQKIVYVFADTTTCYNRMMSRSKGLPVRMKGLNKVEILVFSEIIKRHFDKVMAAIDPAQCEVIAIESNQSLDHTLAVLCRHF